ncbi:MAG: SctD/MshK family protein, partial [Burkholderiaceae bacterium]
LLGWAVGSALVQAGWPPRSGTGGGAGREAAALTVNGEVPAAAGAPVPLDDGDVFALGLVRLAVLREAEAVWASGAVAPGSAPSGGVTSPRRVGVRPFLLASGAIALAAGIGVYLSLPLEAVANTRPAQQRTRAAAGVASQLADAGRHDAVNDEIQQRDLMYRVREFIGDPGISTHTDAKGRIVLTGVARSARTAAQIREARKEFKKVVEILDAVSYEVNENDRKETVAMPVKIRNVFIGGTRYFTTADGMRYFEGGKLSDGAEVQSITMDEIVFVRNGKRIRYDLGDMTADNRG